MKLINNRLFRVALLVVGLVALWINFRMAWSGHTQAVLPISVPQKQVTIPAEGLATTPDSKNDFLGNPQRTVADMHHLYQDIQVFRKRHNGQYPHTNGNSSLLSDQVHNPSEYGYANAVEAMKATRNPDMKYSDMAHGSPQPETYYPYITSGTRPDGTTIGAEKSPGTRDILAYTDIYFHQNIRVFKGDKTTTKPTGFYLVLWDDGEVTKVPYQEVQFATPQQTSMGGLTQTLVFPGQAGASQGTLSRAEYDKYIHDHI